MQLIILIYTEIKYNYNLQLNKLLNMLSSKNLRPIMIAKGIFIPILANTQQYIPSFLKYCRVLPTKTNIIPMIID